MAELLLEEEELPAVTLRDLVLGVWSRVRHGGARQEAVPPPVTAPSSQEPIPPGEPDPALEGDPDDLVLEGWVHCVAKVKYMRSRDDWTEYGSGMDVVDRSLMWRRRRAWVNMDCGEDSFYVSNTRTSLGVADGVGAWRAFGVDPSQFSNQLMARAKAFTEGPGTSETRGCKDPTAIVSAAWESIQDADIKGSSTALVAALDSDRNSGKRVGKASGVLKVSNLGDGRAVVVRNGRVSGEVRELVHRKNIPYQLCNPTRQAMRKHRDMAMNSPEDAITAALPVQEDDVVVLGTDGYFDNVFPDEYVGYASRVVGTAPKAQPRWWHPAWLGGPVCHGDPMDAGSAVKQMVQEAARKAGDRNWYSPYTRDLVGRGAEESDAMGGKPDDITVVLARVVRRRNWNALANVA